MRGSLLEELYRRAGFLKAARVGTFILQWTACSRALGAEPTMDEFIDWWGEPRRTAFRRQAEFREVFPGMVSPAPFAAAVQAELDRAHADAGDRASVAMLAQVAVPA